MSRIKGRYVAQVVIEVNVPRDKDTFPVEKIREGICGGGLTEHIKQVLSEGIANNDEFSLTVDQLFADVYEVDDEGGKDSDVQRDT